MSEKECCCDEFWAGQGHPIDCPTQRHLRACAAIHLRVPDSGEEWLDAMIRRAIHQEDARAAKVEGLPEKGER